MRKRIAACAVSAVLVAVGALAAVKLASPHNGAPRLTATSPETTTSAGPSSGPVVTADPRRAVQGAWLSAAQLPFGSTVSWTIAQAEQGGAPIGQPLTATVFYVAKDTPFQALTACSDPTSLLGRTTGAQHTDFTAFPASGESAGQYVFFFADAVSAQQAFSWLQGQYTPSCRSDSGMTATKTAGDGQTSAAWLIVKGTSASLDGPADMREYFVLRGSTIAYVFISDAAAKLPAAYDDTGQLSTIAAHLCVYGGPCR